MKYATTPHVGKVRKKRKKADGGKGTKREEREKRVNPKFHCFSPPSML